MYVVWFVLECDPGAAGLKGQGEESQANLPAPRLQMPSLHAACMSAPILYQGLQIGVVWIWDLRNDHDKSTCKCAFSRGHRRKV